VVPEPVLNRPAQVLELVNEILNSNDGKYKGNDSQTEENEEREKDNELSQNVDDTDHQSAWGAQRPIGHEFLSLQRSILTITPGNTQSSSRGISYPEGRTPAPVRVSHNGYTCPIRSCLPTFLNPSLLATPAIILSHLDLTMLELDSRGEQLASSRQNIATGLERSILAGARDLMWDWMIFVTLFPQSISLTEDVQRCWGEAQTQPGFPDFAESSPASNDQVSYP